VHKLRSLLKLQTTSLRMAITNETVTYKITVSILNYNIEKHAQCFTSIETLEVRHKGVASLDKAESWLSK